MKKPLKLFLPLFLLFITSQIVSAETGDWTYQDDNIAMNIEVNQKNIIDADDVDSAIKILPEGEFTLSIKYEVLGDETVNITGFTLTIQMLDLDTFSYSDELQIVGDPGEYSKFNQSLLLGDYLSIGGFQPVSGVYKLRLEMTCIVDEDEQVLSFEPFYVKIAGNPLLTVTGVMSTAGLASAGYYVYRSSKIVNSFSLVLSNLPIESTNIFPTQELINFLKGEYADMLQSEFGQKLLDRAKKMWDKHSCPSCETSWGLAARICAACGITFEVAEEIFSRKFVEKTLQAGEDISTSVSGLQLSQISQSIGEGLQASTDIVSFLAVTGLGIIEPSLGKKMKESTRTLIFTGIYIVIVSFFWIQSMGIDTVSLETLAIGIAIGIILPMALGRFLKNRVLSRVSKFWEKNQSEIPE
jgi:hypothetical protein